MIDEDLVSIESSDMSKNPIGLRGTGTISAMDSVLMMVCRVSGRCTRHVRRYILSAPALPPSDFHQVHR
jgi:hypothetical protein